VASKVAAAIAERYALGSRIDIYRFDPKDGATPYNMDRYRVVENPRMLWNISAIANAASTEDNQNLGNFLQHYVFLVKEDSGSDHWLPALPDKVLSLIHRP
jgi:hypothetical protein